MPKGWRMGSSTPQEGGTTDEEYYGQPQQMFNIDLKLTALKKKTQSPLNPPKGDLRTLQVLEIHYLIHDFYFTNCQLLFANRKPHFAN